MASPISPDDYELAVERTISMFETLNADARKAHTYFPSEDLATIDAYIKSTCVVTQLLSRDMMWLALKIVHGKIVGVEDPTNELDRLTALYQTLRVDCVNLSTMPAANVLSEALKIGSRVGEEVYCDTPTTWLGPPSGTPPAPLVAVRPELKAKDDVFTMLRKIICVQKGIPYRPAKPDIMFFQEDVPINERNKAFVDLCMHCLNCFKLLAVKIMKVHFRVPHNAVEYEELTTMYFRFERSVKQIPFFASKICVDGLIDHYRPMIQAVFSKLDLETHFAKTKKPSVEGQVECTNCAATVGVTLKACSRCKLVQYCSRACQVQHWKQGGHKRFCVAVADRSPGSEVSAPSVGDKCMVCLEGLLEKETDTLLCGHVLHAACAQGIKDFAEAQACPMCRKALGL
jgi:hypothetical protein